MAQTYLYPYHKAVNMLEQAGFKAIDLEQLHGLKRLYTALEVRQVLGVDLDQQPIRRFEGIN